MLTLKSPTDKKKCLRLKNGCAMIRHSIHWLVNVSIRLEDDTAHACNQSLTPLTPFNSKTPEKNFPLTPINK